MSPAALVAAALGYALGFIPFGLLLARAAGKGDLRRVGSGNIGATNALRAGGPALGAATLLFDMGKGAGAVLAGGALAGPVGAVAGGLGAFLGHLFSPWLGFRGGKGVATMIGVAAALWPLAGGAFAGVWIAGAAATRYSSVGGIAGAIAAPVAAVVTGAPGAVAVALGGMAALVVFKHRANIGRLMAGTETKIGVKG